jgi:three-Cys-motif partner protein
VEIDESYKGREHSLIKHELLKGYLEKLLSIIGMTGKVNEIVYVDCFAGPWGDDSESLSGTSIAISLDILGKVRNTLMMARRMSGLKFKAIYVEELKSRHKRLSEYLQNHGPDGIECHDLRLAHDEAGATGDYAAFSERLNDIRERVKGLAVVFSRSIVELWEKRGASHAP